MALEKQEPRELYDPEQVRRVVENVEDPETKAILYLAWETALTATEISSLPAGARESCAATLSGERVGSISKKYATKRLKALKCQECLVAIFKRLVASSHCRKAIYREKRSPASRGPLSKYQITDGLAD